MCGLAGIARIAGSACDTRDRLLVASMASAIAHRGPDATEILVDGPVGFAFARLSLVDPETGGQPLLSPDGSLVLIANGEIYNHRELARELGVTGELRGGSDCEVLLHLYRRRGLQFLDGVRGMFSIILWDKANRQLVLARDRFGIKPLYFHRNSERILLGSEIKALFADPAVPRQLDWTAALANPVLSSVPRLGDTPLTTWFDSIESVPAATILRIELLDGRTHSHEYWALPPAAQALDDTDDMLIDRYRDHLERSIADCATADAELGLFLSGGVDSAAVAAIAGKVAPTLHTFTVLSPSTHLNGDAEQARQVAAELGLPNHQVVFDADRVPGVDEWKRLLWLLENPMCGPEQYYKHELHRYAKQVRPEVRGMLLGAAADEFAGGYSVGYSSGDGWDGFLQTLQSMSVNEELRLRPDIVPWADVRGRSLLKHRQPNSGDELYYRYLRWEWRKVQQYNCWHEDRTAAGSGVEARVPFLDHRLVELAASIPSSRRKDLLWDKRILREAVRSHLPARTTDREKVAFYYGPGQRYTQACFARMLQQGVGELVEQALAAPGASEHLDASAMRQVLLSFDDDNADYNVELLLRLTNLGLLSAMAAQPPPPLVTSQADLQPPPPEITRWLTGTGDLAAELGCPVPDRTSVLALADGVELVAPLDQDDCCYVVVDGEVRYQLDSAEPDWLAFFRAIDGSTSLSGMNFDGDDSYLAILSQAAEQGLVVAVG